jgi:uncharacterized protein with NRDE domain
MCLIGLAWRQDPELPLLVVANRDEFHERPTKALHRWSDHTHIIAGRDLRGGGTWMGITDQGRVAMLTNFREAQIDTRDRPSRGELVTDFLLSSEAPEHWVESLALRAHHYAGFNLIVGGLDMGLIYCSNRADTQRLKPGYYALSNGVLSDRWPKTRGLTNDLADTQKQWRDDSVLLGLLEHVSPPTDDELPDTGIGLVEERRLATRMILSGDYGTRASTLLRARANHTTITEYTRDPKGQIVFSAKEVVVTT